MPFVSVDVKGFSNDTASLCNTIARDARRRSTDSESWNITQNLVADSAH